MVRKGKQKLLKKTNEKLFPSSFLSLVWNMWGKEGKVEKNFLPLFGLREKRGENDKNGFQPQWKFSHFFLSFSFLIISSSRNRPFLFIYLHFFSCPFLFKAKQVKNNFLPTSHLCLQNQTKKGTYFYLEILSHRLCLLSFTSTSSKTNLFPFLSPQICLLLLGIGFNLYSTMNNIAFWGQVQVLKVNVNCGGCKRKVKKLLRRIEGKLAKIHCYITPFGPLLCYAFYNCIAITDPKKRDLDLQNQ